MKIYLVEWVDSNFTHGWRDKQEIMQARHMTSNCVSVGISNSNIGFDLVLKEKTVEIKLWQSQSDDNVGDIISIPRECIKRIRQLKVSFLKNLQEK